MLAPCCPLHRGRLPPPIHRIWGDVFFLFRAQCFLVPTISATCRAWWGLSLRRTIQSPLVVASNQNPEPNPERPHLQPVGNLLLLLLLLLFLLLLSNFFIIFTLQSCYFLFLSFFFLFYLVVFNQSIKSNDASLTFPINFNSIFPLRCYQNFN